MIDRIAKRIKGSASGDETDHYISLLEKFILPLQLCWASQKNDLKKLGSLLRLEADSNLCDYDGR